MSKQKLENSVKNLVNLYTVVIGVALSITIISLVDREEGLRSIEWSELLLFVAFVFTLLPFYHGALRHLDNVYLESPEKNTKTEVLILDFLLLFIHAMAFVVLAMLLKNPNHFAIILIGLVAIDIAWGCFVFFGAQSIDPDGAEGKWTLINLAFVFLFGFYLINQGIWLDPIENKVEVSFAILISCSGRTLVDYIVCRRYYFPQGESSA